VLIAAIKQINWALTPH